MLEYQGNTSSLLKTKIIQAGTSAMTNKGRGHKFEGQRARVDDNSDYGRGIEVHGFATAFHGQPKVESKIDLIQGGSETQGPLGWTRRRTD